MKKILILMVMLLGFAFFNQAKAVDDGNGNVVVKDEKMLGADFSNGVYAYELGKKFTKSPNTISAWVRMGNLGINEIGGTIFSNYCADNKQAIKLEVDSNRNVSLYWNGGQATATFTDYKVAYNEWTMLTVTRDSEHGLFKLYVNGKLQQTINMYAGSDSVCDYRFVIGGDWSWWSVNKKPFRGEISQVTVYEQTLKTKEVYEDYLYSNDISSSNRSGLMFNGYLTYRCSEVLDTSSNNNNATIRSNDLYYEGDIYAAQDYTFAVIPDPQIMTHWNQGNLPTLSKYLIDYNNKYNNKLAMALCVGDNADGVNSSFPQYDMDYQLSAMKAEYDKLYNAGIRWMTTPGNHDYDYNCTNTGDPSTARSLAYYKKFSLLQ